MCLEFSPNVCPAIKPFYDFYSFQGSAPKLFQSLSQVSRLMSSTSCGANSKVIPPMGQVVAGDWDSYQYLVESIRKFPDQERFKLMIEGAGFEAVSYQNYTFGIAVVHDGFKL